MLVCFFQVQQQQILEYILENLREAAIVAILFYLVSKRGTEPRQHVLSRLQGGDRARQLVDRVVQELDAIHVSRSHVGVHGNVAYLRREVKSFSEAVEGHVD